MKRWDSLLRSALESDLRYWAYHHGKQLAAIEGYSPNSVIGEFTPSTNRPGSSVLIRDLPEKAWVTHFELSQLPFKLFIAMIAAYCVPPEAETGRMHSDAELAKAIGCSPHAFRRRVSRAKARILSDRSPIAA